MPGDTLQLAAGTYLSGLTISGMNGLPGAPIEIRGPLTGTPATFNGRSCCNTVSLSNSSYITIRNLTLDGKNLAVDGVKAEGTSQFVHHVVLENLTIVNHGNNQQIVGINTKCPTWNWVIRRCTIIGAGTGIYLGDSNGTQPFVAGIIEDNLVRDTIGYNMEIKHQINRPALAGMPTDAKTVIRRNVWSKAAGASTGGNARPCVLVGHWPTSGAGTNDYYEIYQNFFWQNQATTETLFQGEGNVALYNNLFVNDQGAAIVIQPQNDVPKTIRIFNNTVVAKTTGIALSGGAPGYTQEITGNAVFASPAINGGTQQANATGTYQSRGTFLVNPTGLLGSLDLYPKAGQLSGSPEPTGSISGYVNWNRDFNGIIGNGTIRGAYAGQGSNPGWLPVLSRQPAPATFPDAASAPGTPLTAARLQPDGTEIGLSWDGFCRGPGKHLVYGDLATVSTLAPSGALCDLGGAAATWTGVPGGSLWFLLLGDDLGDAEGSWGRNAAGVERGGTTPSNQCGFIFRDNGGGC
jgi:hypothetical protein